MLDDFQMIIRTIGELPPVPRVAARILQLLQDPEASVKDLASAIEQDPAISARILKVANSVYYSQQREVATLNRAIIVLGENYVRNLVFESCLRITANAFSEQQRNIWEQSLGCAIAARLLAEETGVADENETFLAGLFRHIGKILMIEYNAGIYGEVLAIVERGEGDLIDIERAFFAFSHEKVGAALLDSWNFPPSLVQGTFYHHDLDLLRERHPALHGQALCVHLAGCFGRHLGIGRGAPDRSRPLEESPGAEGLELTPARLSELLQEFGSDFARERDRFAVTL